MERFYFGQSIDDGFIMNQCLFSYMDNELLYKSDVYSLIGCAMEVYNSLKFGYLEAVYQEALEIVLQQRGILFESQVPVVIYFQGKPLEKRYIADLVIEGRILVELKSKSELTRIDEVQLLNYLRGTQIEVGVLINFGNTKKLEWRRFALTNTYEYIDGSSDVFDEE